MGEGTATGVPDRCMVYAALNVMADTPAEVVSRLAVVAAQAVDAVRANGVAPADVRTTNLSVQDFFDHSVQRVTARTGSYQLEVVVRDPDRVGELLAAIAQAAGDSFQVRALQLTVGDPEPLRHEARRDAVDDARRKAAQLADAAGVRLGPILSIEEGLAAMPGPYRAFGRQKMSKSAGVDIPPVPVEPGSLSVTERVVLRYAID